MCKINCSGDCKECAPEEHIKDLNEQLAASQAREQQLRAAVDWMCANGCNCRIGQDARALPTDTSALDTRLAEEREKCRKVTQKFNCALADEIAKAIRSMT